MSKQSQYFSISSPNKEIIIHIKTTDKTYYSIDYKQSTLLWYSPISMTLSDGQILGKAPVIIESKQESINETIVNTFGIRKKVANEYEEIKLIIEGNYSLIFRAYNDGVAYRFTTDFDHDITITHEEVAFRFLNNAKLLAHVVGDFQTSYEKLYTNYTIDQVIEEEFISLPLLVESNGIKAVISESDLYDYPGMYLSKKENNRFDLTGLFPAYPTETEFGGLHQYNLRVTKRADYLAQTNGRREFPWRHMSIASEEKDLMDSDMVFKLARPSLINTDWVKPGKVAWDWFNDWNLTGVDFETGVNNKTYEYYIDFASNNKLEYVILDDGWSDPFDLHLTKPEIDIPHLVQYASERNVRIILWCVWHTLDQQMDSALDQFMKWGIAGIKVDFIDRDDQIAVEFYERLAKEAAQRKLLVDIHGCSKPTGLNRTYPNVLSFEGVRGNEYNKFDRDETPQHSVDLVFTRMLAGPMDYTPGSMRNSTKGNFFMDNSNPMSHGTRCHQLAMFVVYFSPLQMLCDAPTAYQKFPDILSFLSEVPTVWDETISLDAKLGEFVVIARKKEDIWYIGGLTNWSERTITLDLSFLNPGQFEAHIFCDGMNAHRNAEDYQYIVKNVHSSQKIPIRLKSGGGTAVQLKSI